MEKIVNKPFLAGIVAAIVLITAGCQHKNSTGSGKPEQFIPVRQSGDGAAEISVDRSAWQSAKPGARLSDGSVSMDSGFYSGSEYLGDMIYSPFLRFRLNGRLVSPKEYESAISRGLLNGWLPATEFTYRQTDTQAGWEELVFTGLHQGKQGVFIRFRVANFSAVAAFVI
jgi:hypothetical protein